MNSIDLRDLIIDSKASIGEVFSLRGAFPTYTYVDGKATTTRDGTRYRVVTPIGTLNVKVRGSQNINFDANDTPINIHFRGLTLYIYYRDGKPMIAGKADAVEAVDMED